MAVANFGSSASIACSSCSSTRCSCSESGTMTSRWGWGRRRTTAQGGSPFFLGGFRIGRYPQRRKRYPASGSTRSSAGLTGGTGPGVRAGGAVVVRRAHAGALADVLAARVDERGRSHAAGAEPRAGAVDGLLGVAPPERLLVQQQLALVLLDRLQALDAHADQPHPAPLQPQCVEQLAGRGVDVAGDVR